jgi:hypothetical protein
MAAAHTRLGHASPLIKAKIALKDPQRTSGFVERTTLFLVALKKAQAHELLDGFSSAPRERARVYAQQLVDLDSATRQARVAREFGPSGSFPTRIHELVVRSPPALRNALYAQLPPPLRPTGFTPLPASPALQALASRLVRELRFG